MVEHTRSMDSYGRRLASAIGSVCASMISRPPRISPGDRASLWRAEGGPAFWKVVVDELEPRHLLPGTGSPDRADVESHWIAILSAVALLAEQHDPKHGLGQAMGEPPRAGSLVPMVSEARFTRLLRAQGDALVDALRGVAQQLASSGRRANLVDVASLVLSSGTSRGDDIRRRIALNYYRQHRVGAAEKPQEKTVTA